MKINLILPCIGKKKPGSYVPTWQMEPLTIATLAGLTPQDVELTFYDDRIEDIDYDSFANLVAISVETYTARRSYQIAAEFRKRGIPVILGGYHVMLAPEEASSYADSIFIGYAENLWRNVISDCKKGRLQKVYEQPTLEGLNFTLPDRSIFASRRYMKIHSVETSRGCQHNCIFCSISSASRSQYCSIPINRVVNEVSSLRNKSVFFVDDNFISNIQRTMDLLRELQSFHLRWTTQGSLQMAKYPELLKLMADSGCVGVLIGFESFKQDTLRGLNKNFLISMGNVEKNVKIIHDHGIGIYGTFIFGADSDSLYDYLETTERAIKLKLFLAAFAPLLPFPGTPLYFQLKKEGRLINDPWWLNGGYRFNDVAFNPKNMEPFKLREYCIEARKKYYNIFSILKRLGNFSGNAGSFHKLSTYIYANLLLRNEIAKKDGIPLGF